MLETNASSLKIESRMRAALLANIEVASAYPNERFRFSLESDVTIPPGLWDTPLKGGMMPGDIEQQELERNGCTLDQYGRPLHPWIQELACPTGTGVVANKGEFWNWGPNRTVDPVIIAVEGARRYVLLVRRRDNRLWALPGGFIDPGETEVEAGIREAGEEAGLRVSRTLSRIVPALIYKGPVADYRSTGHAWPETTALRWVVDHRMKLYPDCNEVIGARWWPIEKRPVDLHGSHNLLLEEGLYGDHA